MKTRTLATVIIAAPLLASCGNTPSSVTGAGSAACRPGDNLLANPTFAVDERGRRKSWSASQHAGEPSFEVEATGEGEIRISKTGTQHWFLLSQRVPIDAVRGRDLVYSAELKLDLHDEDLSHAFEVGGGLNVLVRGQPGSGPDHNGILLRMRFEHEPHIGKHDWTPVQMAFTVPMDATSLRVGITDYADGSMWIRKPRLSACD